MNFNPRPAQLVSPGEILSAELEARGWSQKDLAEITGRPHQAINEIVKGSKQITPDTAIEFAQAFGTSSEFWLNLESSYRLHQAEKQKRRTDTIAKRSRLFELVPVRELIKRGWIKATKRIEELEEEICRFLDIPSIQQIPVYAQANFRHAEHLEPESPGQRAWMARVNYLARQQKLGRFSHTNTINCLDKVLDCSKKDADVARIPEMLLSAGIHFVIVRHLPKTYLDGATWTIGRNPVIAITLRYDRIDSFWFTLLHEMAHIYRKHSGTFLDDLYNGISSGKPEKEKEANKFATSWLIVPKDLNSFVQNTTFYYSKAAVETFAAEHGRHPGIVVGQMQYAHLMGYNFLRNYLVKVSPYLKKWMDPTFYYNVRKEIE